MLNSKTITLEQLAKTIDHSLLKPEMTIHEVVAGCELAAKYKTASVCAKPSDVQTSVEILNGTGVAVGTVIGFPHGSNLTGVKVFEAVRALEAGATELDMVLNIGRLRSGEIDFVCDDVAAVVHAAKGKALVKVILENAYLTKDEIVSACKICESAGADFVKTSTGYAPSGATIEDVRLMRASVGKSVQVKAAGGIRTLDSLLEFIDAGATRVGATATKVMLDAFADGARSSEQPATAGY